VKFDRVEQVAEKVSRDGFFFGKRVVLTGALEKFTREEAQKELRLRGAKVVGTVGKTTDYVIAGTDATSKLKAAEKLGVSILDEAEFVKIINIPSPI
jgi:DNA ligase (NAD+)